MNEGQSKQTINTYVYLCQTSKHFLEIAKKTPSATKSPSVIASLMFTAFMVEAYCNHLGKEKFPDWEKIEKLCTKVGLNHDNGVRPLQTISELFKFRNSIAHGRSISEPIQPNGSMCQPGEFSLTEYEDIVWQKYENLDKAERAFEDACAFIGSLHRMAGLGNKPFKRFSHIRADPNEN